MINRSIYLNPLILLTYLANYIFKNSSWSLIIVPVIKRLRSFPAFVEFSAHLCIGTAEV